MPIPVDLVRFVAIALVVLCHAAIEPYGGAQLSSSWLTTLWGASAIYNAISRSCVPMFLMLSGALLLQPTKLDEPIGVFLKKRVLRVGLAFAFWSLIYFAWDAFAFGQIISADYVVRTLVGDGPHYQFWYIYAIIGLYLATPVLRTIVAYGDRKIQNYLTILWFVAASAMPVFRLVTGLSINSTLFVLSGWIGYFMLGAYLINVKVPTRTLLAALAGSFAFTVFGAWLMAYPYAGVQQTWFFMDFLAPNVVVYSVSMFMLLKARPANWPGENHPRLSKFVHAVSQNTLPIFFFHALVLETLEKGYLGFNLSLTAINPAWEIPVAATVCFFLTVGLVLAMKKVPVLNKLMG